MGAKLCRLSYLLSLIHIFLEVKQATGQSRYDQIVEMIQRSEQMKSAAEAKASNLADKLVPYTCLLYTSRCV